MKHDARQDWDDRPSDRTESRQEYRDWGRISQEEKYCRILGVTDTDSRAVIKEKYRELLAKYHPDKLQHLGKEFQEIAEQKTRSIIEAYEFFQKRYNF
jgi:DnaJ like chaperone protein